MGLTLVEVIAACALLSSMLVGVMLAFSNCQRQLEASTKVEHACELADGLLYSWTADGSLRPPAVSGTLPNDWSWKLVPVGSKLSGLDIIELQMIHREESYQKVQLVIPR